MYEVAEAAHNRPSLPPCVWLPQARFLLLRFLYFVWNILRGDYKRYVFVCVVSHLDWVGSCVRCVGWDLSRLLCTFIYICINERMIFLLFCLRKDVFICYYLFTSLVTYVLVSDYCHSHKKYAIYRPYLRFPSVVFSDLLHV